MKQTIIMLMHVIMAVARECELNPAQRRLVDSSLLLADKVVHYEGEKI